MHLRLSINFLVLCSSLAVASPEQTKIETKSLFDLCHKTDLEFIEFQNTEKFRPLRKESVLIDNGHQIHVNAESLARESEEMEQVVLTPVRQLSEKENCFDYSFEKYSSNVVKMFRLMIENEFVPYPEEVLKEHPDLLDNLILLLHRHGLNDHIQTVIEVYKNDGFKDIWSHLLNAIGLLNLDSEENDTVSLLTHLAYKSPRDTSKKSQFILFFSQYQDIFCEYYPALKMLRQAFEKDSLSLEIYRLVYSRYARLAPGNTEALTLFDAELKLLQDVYGLSIANSGAKFVFSSKELKNQEVSRLNQDEIDQKCFSLPSKPTKSDSKKHFLANLKKYLFDRGIYLNLDKTQYDYVVKIKASTFNSNNGKGKKSRFRFVTKRLSGLKKFT